MPSFYLKKLCLLPLGLALSIFLLACNDEEKNTEAPKSTSVEVSHPAPAKESPDKKSLFIAKVRQVVGETDVQKGGSDVWKLLRVSQKVVENDRIRTAQESNTVLAVDDGSTLKIDENSDITLTAQTVNEAKADEMDVSVLIVKGNVIFDIQKQKGRTIKFKTETAVAAIRGTAGFVGNANGQMVASLKEGRVEVSTANGKVTDVLKNQTVIVSEKGTAKKLNLASSGTNALTSVIDSIVQSNGNEIPQEQLEKALRKFDKGYAARQKAFEKKLKFNALPIAPTVYEPNVVLVAQATPGILVTVMGQTDTVPANGFYQKTVGWLAKSYGTKRFLASCSDGYVEVPCFMWITEYAEQGAAPAAETVESSVAPAKAAVEKTAPEAVAPAKNLNLSVKLGARTEKVHLDLPATTLKTNLKINLAGITAADLNGLKSIVVERSGQVVKTFDEDELTAMNYEVPVEIERNKIADFDVVVTAKNGKKFRGKKTYEVYCLLSNHPGGKARNFLLSKDQEYERLKQSGGITHE